MKDFFEEHKWKRSRADHFWHALAPCDHVIQIYEDDEVFVAMLATFVRISLQTGDGVILIASQEHRLAVEQRLKAMNIPIDSHLNRHYFPVDAQILLSSITINGQKEEILFNQEITRLLEQVRQFSRKVFVFCEMVAI